MSRSAGRVLLLGVLLAGLTPSSATAEFLALQAALKDPVAELAKQTRDRPVLVVVRNITGLTPPWRVTAAIQTELVASLLAAQVDATDAGRQRPLAFLMEGDEAFKTSELQRAARIVEEGLLLLGQLENRGGVPTLRLQLVVLPATDEVFSTEAALKPADLTLPANVPELNRKIVAYARSHLGQVVGGGDSWDFAAAAHRESGGKRRGTYLFGRDLAEHEAILPGDILQFEGVRFHEKDGKRRSSMRHHTAVVADITAPDSLKIIHGGFNGKEAKEYTLHLADMREGIMLVYRPDTGSPILPGSFPRRSVPAQPAVLGDGRVNLLRTLDPLEDSVRGVWHNFDGHLQNVRESFTTLQVPYDLPQEYTLHLTLRRAARNDTFGLGLVVGGHQGLLAIDAYGGEVTGFHTLDGKTANDNASTAKGQVLPLEKLVDLECRVTPRSVKLTADGRLVIDWTGDPSGLSVASRWRVPNEDWLFVAAHESVFEITKFDLTAP